MTTAPIRYAFFASGKDAAQFGRHCEELGADGLAWGESPTQFRDPYSEMLRVAQVTERVLLGTVMTAPGLRHPAVLANQFMAVQQHSGGRAFCGIGSGDLSLIEMGEKPFRMEQFVEYATAVKRLMAGEDVVWNGNKLRMRLPDPTPPVPVWFGADGPRTQHAAGMVADGLIVGQVGSPDVVRTVLKRAQAGAAEAGRSIDDLDIWFMLRAVVTDRPDGAVDIDGLDEYATRALRYLWRTSGQPGREEFAQTVLERKGVRLDDDVADRLWQFNDAWVAADAFGTKTNVELMDRFDLRDFAGRYFYISGPPDHVASGVQELIDAGARNFFTPFISLNRDGVETEMAEILNSLR